VIRGQRSAPEATAPRVEDPELLRQLAAGQLGALGELYDRYQAPLRSFLVRATRDAHDSDDLLHATFLAAAASAERYDGRACCRPWLVGIAVQLLRRRRRSFKHLLRVLGTLKDTRVAATDPRAAFQARAEVEGALGRLSEAKRVTLLMAEVEGMSCPEIAEALEIPVGTVWTRLHAARRELRQALGAEGAEP
jgi:RNA polymerase sigma factor (sigma-70 family)